MTQSQYNSLDEMEQAEALWNKGVHVAERADEEHNILLYQVDSFYVEVYYHRDYNVIRRFNTFSGVEQLQSYIGKIDIDKLIR